MLKQDLNSTQEKKRVTLFNIQAELDALFDTIEENGGEINEEIEKALEVTQNNLVDKLSDYVSAIKLAKLEVSACKDEKKRIDDVRKRNEKRIDMMNMAVRDAVLRFGSENKNGNKFIDLGLNKVTVTPSRATVIDEDFVNAVIKGTDGFLRRLVSKGDIEKEYSDVSKLLYDLISYLNEDMKMKLGDNAREVTVDDITQIQCSVIVTDSIAGIIADQQRIIESLNCVNSEIVNATNATLVKKLTESGMTVSFASPSPEYTVSIR